LFVAAFSICSARAFVAVPYYYLTINVNNILVQKGKMHIGIYNNKQDFDKKKYYTGKITGVRGRTAKIVFKLPKGTYAVQMFQDTNNNNNMDNIFGVPLEPYGVSGNASGFPSFKKTRFTLDKNKSINIKLKN
jgi:uncharacterized protein (DUF2141 family)